MDVGVECGVRRLRRQQPLGRKYGPLSPGSLYLHPQLPVSSGNMKRLRARIRGLDF